MYPIPQRQEKKTSSWRWCPSWLFLIVHRWWGWWVLMGGGVREDGGRVWGPAQHVTTAPFVRVVSQFCSPVPGETHGDSAQEVRIG